MLRSLRSLLTGALAPALFALATLAAVQIAVPGRALAQDAAPEATMMPAVSAGTYQPQIGDVLRITVFNETELSGDFAVTSDGKVSMPLINQIQATGRSLSDIAAEITSRLKPDYLTDPKVSVLIVSYRPIIVLGEVNKPGSYEFRQGMTVVEAVGLAGGFTYRANTRAITARRSTEPVARSRAVKPEDTLAPGDVVTISQRYF